MHSRRETDFDLWQITLLLQSLALDESYFSYHFLDSEHHRSPSADYLHPLNPFQVHAIIWEYAPCKRNINWYVKRYHNKIFYTGPIYKTLPQEKVKIWNTMSFLLSRPLSFHFVFSSCFHGASYQIHITLEQRISPQKAVRLWTLFCIMRTVEIQ